MHLEPGGKRFFRTTIGVWLWLSIFPVGVQGASGPPFEKEPVSVFVSILPQKYFVEKIGGSRVHVSVMVLPGANPATYEPKPRQIAGLSKAKIYFAAGVPFEGAWLDRIVSANNRVAVVHTDEGIEKMEIKAHFHKEKKHHGDVHRSGEDPHTWLSPLLVKSHARNILKALIEADPTSKILFETNYQKFSKEIDALDAELKTLFSGAGQKTAFMVFHPAWGYFARDYGLKQVAVEVEGKEPKPRDLQRLIQWARAQDIKVIFAQKQFSTKSAAEIAKAVSGRVIHADPLAENWSKNLLLVAGDLKDALR